MSDDQFGSFRLIEHIDGGGSADIYLAVEQSSGETVALKILKPEFRGDPETGQKLLEEGTRLSKLYHPGIVAVRGTGTVDDAPYIVMELIEGKTLQQILQEVGQLPQKQVLQIVASLADALDYAHRQGLVHRDLKPAHILVTGNRVTLTDFGIARASGVKATRAMATPRYMSPEQATGNVLEGRSDLFSLGAIAYEMLSGEYAFDADSLPSLIEQVKSRQPPPLEDRVPELTRGTRAIVTRLLAKDPDDRFACGRDVVAAVTAELRHPTTSAQRRITSRRIGLALAAVILMGLAAWLAA